MKKLALVSLATLILTACQPSTPPSEPVPPQAEQPNVADVAGESTAATTENIVPAIDFDGFDRSVRPQDDFERYVNGGWYDNTEMPAHRGRYGVFAILDDQASEQIRSIIEELSARDDLQDGSEPAKIRDMFNSFMDEQRIESLGLQPVQAELDRVAALSDLEDLARYFGQMSRSGVSHPMGMGISQDAGEPERYTVYFSQSGLGLPDRAYYLEGSPQMQGIQEAYREYLQKLFAAASIEDPEGAARRVYDLEAALAEQQWTRVANRDRNRTYNPVDGAGLRALIPEFPWDAFLAEVDLQQRDAFVVRQPGYFEGLATIFGTTSMESWRDYMRAKVLGGAAQFLHSDIARIQFDFYGRRLQGLESEEPRWQRGVNLVNGGVGELIGKIYVERHFPPEAKARMDELVINVKRAMSESLETLDWMTDETRAEAQQKLSSFNTKIGYPDEWRDYSALQVSPDDLVGNMRRVAEFGFDRRRERLDGPIDRNEWGMTPQRVNAYYSSTLNEIVFPAGILQPPFFNLHADDAVNYGAIGMVIGHEIGHGFDDQGRKSDGTGRLRDWWTEADAAEYTRRTDRLVAQYDAFNPIDDQHINGRLALGENIGDLGGLTLAYRAWQLSLDGKEPEVIDGYTGAQRFFLSFAQSWRSKYRDDALRQHLRTGPHSPPRYRVMGVLPNFTPFHEAFNVQPGDGMYRPEDERVAIW